MDGARRFAAIGVIRHARPGGFCPAYRLLMKARAASQELAKPTVAVTPIKRASQARC